MSVTRRRWIGATLAGGLGLAGALLARKKAKKVARLRPPGALPEDEFQRACARCFKCGDACPNKCIQYQPPEDGPKRAFTPYIEPRKQACTLCGECAKVCPTGALQRFESSREGWLAGVDMGMARVNQGMCLSYNGRTCGACYRACPLAGQALRVGLYETPIVDPAQCVGCGLCEKSCLHVPQAIRVIPREQLTSRVERRREAEFGEGVAS